MPKEEKKTEELVPVGDGVEAPEKVESETTEAQTEDEKVGQEASDEESDGDDGDEPSQQTDRKLTKRQAERRRHKERIRSDRRELEFLRQRNEQLERAQSEIAARQDRLEDSTVDGRIGQLDSQIREAETIHTEAVKNADGATATEALRVKGELEKIRNKLQGGKEERAKAREQEQETQQRTTQVARPDPEAVRNGREWLRNNAWFDPQLQDEDSYLARAIEERLAREGELDPSEPEYWEELNRRIEKRLPDVRKRTSKSRNGDDDDGRSTRDVDWDDDDERPKKTEKKQPRGPRISVGGRTRALKPNEVHLSAARVEALKQAGIWDDPEKKQRYLKAYKSYDDDAASRNS